METKIDKKLHMGLLSIIETVDKNEEQLKEMIKRSIFEDANIPDEHKEYAIKMYTEQVLQMRRSIMGQQEATINKPLMGGITVL